MESEQHLSFWSEVCEPLTGDTELHRVVRRNDCSKIAEIVNTVYVDVLNNRWESPLIAAAQSGRAACITALLGHGARVDHQYRHGNTALHYVAFLHHMKSVEALVESNANCNILNCDGKSPIHFLVDNGNITMISYIVGKRPIDLDVNNGKECGPFLYALKRGCNRMVRYFLSVGYDPTILHADGNSSLHIAMRSLDPVILRAVSKNFSVNIKNKDGPSPVALAILFNNDAATFNNVILNDLLLAFPIVSFNDIGNKNYFLK
jgi:ankyrin repeat protein